MTKISQQGCPVCGFIEFTALDEHGCTTFDICPSCNCESGYEYQADSPPERFKELRKKFNQKNQEGKSRLP